MVEVNNKINQVTKNKSNQNTKTLKTSPANQNSKSSNNKTTNSQEYPRKRNVFLIYLLTMITSGIYAPIWYLKRKNKFDNLGTEKKLNKNFIVAYLILSILMALISVVLNIFYSFSPELFENLWNSLAFVIIFIILIICLIVISIILSFNARKIINQAWVAKGVKRKVSWLFTLIFNLFYLQYEINRTVDNKEMEKRVGPWLCFILLIILPFILVLRGIIWFIFNSVSGSIYPVGIS